MIEKISNSTYFTIKLVLVILMSPRTRGIGKETRTKVTLFEDYFPALEHTGHTIMSTRKPSMLVNKKHKENKSDRIN